MALSFGIFNFKNEIFPHDYPHKFVNIPEHKLLPDSQLMMEHDLAIREMEMSRQSSVSPSTIIDTVIIVKKEKEFNIDTWLNRFLLLIESLTPLLIPIIMGKMGYKKSTN